MTSKDCKVCNTAFEAKIDRAVYCSGACRTKAYRETDHGKARGKEYRRGKGKDVLRANRIRFLENNPEKTKEYNDKALSKYRGQAAAARRRGVGFNLSFDQWLWFWNGHWDKRGKAAHQLCMCRKGDKGAYEIGNIYLDTNSNNSKLMNEIRWGSQ